MTTSKGDIKRIADLKKSQKLGHHSRWQWAEMLKMCGCCLVCGSKEGLTKDHIIPISRGGSDSLLNVQPLCRSCNTSRFSRGVKDFRPKRLRDYALKRDRENMKAWRIPRRSKWLRVRAIESIIRSAQGLMPVARAKAAKAKASSPNPKD